MKHKILVLTLLAGFLPSAAAQAQTKELTTLVEGNNQFALDMYQQIGQKPGNKFFSPYSISTALGMTYAGAREQTALEMARTLHFALGKIFDDLAEYETAMQHFDEGNRLKHRRNHFDGANFAAVVDWSIEAFRKEALKASVASDSELPIFIVGMPRSGTTLTEQILASHPRVAAGGELTFWLQRLDRIRNHLDRAAEEDVVRDYLALLTGIAPDALRREVAEIHRTAAARYGID